MSFLDKLRNQPESTRKLILWVVVVIIGLGLTIWWINSSYRKIKEFPKEGIIDKMSLPAFEEKLPKMEMPTVKEQ